MRTSDIRQRKSVPVPIRILRFMERGLGVNRPPVVSIVGGNIGAIGAYGDPGFGGGVVSYRGAVAVGWDGGRLPTLATFTRVGCGLDRVIRLEIVSTDSDA